MKDESVFKMTSVEVHLDTYAKFKEEAVKVKVSFTNLVDFAMSEFNSSQEFRKLVRNHKIKKNL